MSQPIPYKPGKVVVQMVVYLPSLLTQMPVLASFLKGGSEETLSVSELKTGIPEGFRDQQHRSAPMQRGDSIRTIEARQRLRL